MDSGRTACPDISRTRNLSAVGQDCGKAATAADGGLLRCFTGSTESSEAGNDHVAVELARTADNASAGFDPGMGGAP
jgi:hypothetical protein